jgi:tetratricopeptide (TPR) repeat protein
MVDYDGVDTPEALAREAKDKGNAAFLRGPDFYGHALRHYGECVTHASRSAALRPGKKAAEEEDAEDALARKHATAAAAVTGARAAGAAAGGDAHIYAATGPGAREMRELISVAHANVAAIHLARKKYVTAVEAAERALRANPANVKAAYRAAKVSAGNGGG